MWFMFPATLGYRLSSEGIYFMAENKNYEILNSILGPDGRCPVPEPYRGDEQDGSDFIRYLECKDAPFEERFRKFLPKENKR